MLWMFLSLFLIWNVLEGTESCQISRIRKGSDLLRVNCRGYGLNSLPVRGVTDNPNVISLDMSQNNITRLGQSAFYLMKGLVFLNLSTSNIEHIDGSAFSGMHQLNILDLTRNPGITNMTNDVFSDCTQLKKLKISGYPITGTVLERLQNVEELVLTPSEGLPYRLARLQNLQVLNFAFCHKLGPNLTKAHISPFVNSNITQMAFHVCGIRHIENGTFENFTSLKLLNLFGNDALHVDTVIDALSSSANVAVTSLILDTVGLSSGRDLILRGPCKSAMEHIVNLSARATRLTEYRSSFKNCLPQLQRLSWGANSPENCDYGTVLFLLRNLISMDMSYLNTYDQYGVKTHSGYYINQSWIRYNEHYFPPVQPMSIKKYFTDMPYPSGCRTKINIPMFPPNLSYIQADHFFALEGTTNDLCATIRPNTLSYLNISNSMNSKPFKTGIIIVGFDYLEVIDFSNSYIVEANFGVLKYAPSLREIYIQRNRLNCSGLYFPNLPTVERLDLSDNLIREFPKGSFSGLSNIKYLHLALNELRNLGFITYNMSALKEIDVSANQIVSIDSKTTHLLDKLDGSFGKLSLDISSNPLQCDCPEADFIAWIQTTKITIKNKDELTCKKGQEIVNILKIDIAQLHRSCEKINVLMLTIVSVFIALGAFTTSLMVYRYRWAIKWRYYRFRYQSVRRQGMVLLENVNYWAMHCTYVIFPTEDDAVRSWVYGVLRPKVEDEWDIAPMFLKGRDDIPGETNLDNIVRGTMQSETAIWIISPAFLNDHMCEIAANFAFEHLGVRKNLLVIMDTDCTRYGIPRVFLSLMDSRIGLQKLRYTCDEDGRNLFWAKLNAFIVMHCN